MSWADARRPVPRLWIRSAEGVGAGGNDFRRREHNNILCVFIFQIILIFDVFFFFQN